MADIYLTLAGKLFLLWMLNSFALYLFHGPVTGLLPNKYPGITGPWERNIIFSLYLFLCLFTFHCLVISYAYIVYFHQIHPLSSFPSNLSPVSPHHFSQPISYALGFLNTLGVYYLFILNRILGGMARREGNKLTETGCLPAACEVGMRCAPSPTGAVHIPGRRWSRGPSWRPFCTFKSRPSKFSEPACLGLKLTYLLEYQGLLKQIPPGNESPALPQFSPAVFWWGFFMFVFFFTFFF